MIEWLQVPIAYLIGSLSSAIIVCRLMGLPDPREQGSNNPGATNVMRIAGKKAAAITLAGDALKGTLPVLAAKILGADSVLIACVVFAAFLGHLYPIFFGFKGGKGVATSFGVSLGVHFLLGLATCTTWLIVYKISKISSLSALITAVLVPFYTAFLLHDTPLTIVFTLIPIVLIWRHRSNIKKLWQGTED